MAGLVNIRESLSGMVDFLQSWDVSIKEKLVIVTVVARIYDRIDKDLDYDEQRYKEMMTAFENEFVAYLSDLYRCKNHQLDWTAWRLEWYIADGLGPQDPPTLNRIYDMFWDTTHEKVRYCASCFL